MPVTKDCGRAAALIAKTSRAAARATSGIGTRNWKHTAALDDGSSVYPAGGLCSPSTIRNGRQYSADHLASCTNGMSGHVPVR